METSLSEQLRNAIAFSHDEAIRLGSEYIGVEHIFLGILREPNASAYHLLNTYNISMNEIRKKIESSMVESNIPFPRKKEVSLPLNRQADRIFKLMYLEAKTFQISEVDIEHAILAILREGNNIVAGILNGLGISYDNFKSLVFSSSQKIESLFPKNNIEGIDMHDDPAFSQGASSQAPQNLNPKSQTPVLDNFGRDLTRAAKENLLDPIVGRQQELDRIAQILSRRKKNNPILIGEPGVGKSAIAEGLALRIMQRKVPRVLFGKRVISLDLASLVAGTKYRGQFEERMKAVLNELEKNRDIIIFIDEIHTLVGAGNSAGSLDASNMFKPALARGEIQCIGATTLDEYRQNIEKDGALERRFQKVFVEATSDEETLEILKNIKLAYENHHCVNYTDEALAACVFLTRRYITDRFMPDKAIDALDEAGAAVHIRCLDVPSGIIQLEDEINVLYQKTSDAISEKKFEKAAQLQNQIPVLKDKLEQEKTIWEAKQQKTRPSVTADHITEVVSVMSGVPIQKVAEDEGQRLLSMETELQKTVIGQEEAVSKIVRAIRRNRAGLKDPMKPIGNFIFLGPTGVGKTYLTKMLAQTLFHSDSALIRIDMSEYMEKFAVSRLIGAPPGYVGYEDGGQLTEKVRRKPYSIILFDEIEKAHPDIFNLLLQVLDEGQLTDSVGRKVDFRNTVIIMTSNIGSRQLNDFGIGMGFNTSSKESNRNNLAQGVIENALKKHFAPEFLNRIDDIIVFKELKRENILRIIDIEAAHLYKRMEALGVKLILSQEVKDFLIDEAWDPNFGARPLKRALQRYIEDSVAEELLKQTIRPGQIVNVILDKDNKEVKVEIKTPLTKPKEKVKAVLSRKTGKTTPPVPKKKGRKKTEV